MDLESIQYSNTS